MAVDRVISLKAPYFYRSNVEKRSAVRMSLITFVTAAIVAASTSIFIALNKDTNQCEMSLDMLTNYASLSVSLFSLSIWFVIPFLILITSNVIFVDELHSRSRKKRRALEAQIAAITVENSILKRKLEKQMEDEKKERSYTKMLAFLTIAFLTFSALKVLTIYEVRKSKVRGLVDQREILLVVSRFFFILSSSTNYAFNLMSGKAYRNAFVAAVKHRWQKISRRN